VNPEAPEFDDYAARNGFVEIGVLEHGDQEKLIVVEG
jgi:hypothetical protein